MDKIQEFRQPMVTATGIFLGFMLNFTSGWMSHNFTKTGFKEVVVAFATVVSIASLIIVLFRILRMNYPSERSNNYYRKTLVFFLVGISIPFLAFLVLLFQKLLLNA